MTVTNKHTPAFVTFSLALETDDFPVLMFRDKESIKSVSACTVCDVWALDRYDQNYLHLKCVWTQSLIVYPGCSGPLTGSCAWASLASWQTLHSQAPCLPPFSQIHSLLRYSLAQQVTHQPIHTLRNARRLHRGVTDPNPTDTTLLTRT